MQNSVIINDKYLCKLQYSFVSIFLSFILMIIMTASFHIRPHDHVQLLDVATSCHDNTYSASIHLLLLLAVLVEQFLYLVIVCSALSMAIRHYSCFCIQDIFCLQTVLSAWHTAACHRIFTHYTFKQLCTRTSIHYLHKQ